MKKAELLQWLQNEQRQWEALLVQIDSAQMAEPGVVAHWSMKDLIAHLNGWQTKLIGTLAAAQRGEPEPPPPWPADLSDEHAVNAWIYARNQNRALDEVLAESEQQFQQLLAIITDLPDDVRIEADYRVIHLGDKRFSASEFFDHFHDDHEPDVQAWLAQEPS
ncbi:MAG: ClbS/DfsB family four-helix bundle protein [Caldilineaceae bacterium]|nr:ClbS/DfsB family four-helix bundle protein [Caldilineaceae bacterium]